MDACTNTLSAYACSREALHPGACRSTSGHWWAQYDSGRSDMTPNNPLSTDTASTPDYRCVWV